MRCGHDACDALRMPGDARARRDRLLSEVLLAKMLALRLMPHDAEAPVHRFLRSIEPGEAHLLLQAMAAAARADGEFSDAEARRIVKVLETAGFGREDVSFFESQVQDAPPLEALLAGVQDARQAIRFYTASLLAIDRQARVNRSYLRYLADRLQIPPDVAARLNRQRV